MLALAFTICMGVVVMKLNAWILACMLGLCSLTHATNQHVYPKADAVGPSAQWAGSCEIEIINNSFSDVRVFGIFDDGMPLEPFNVYSFEQPHYISLFYNGYCHRGMELDIDTFSGRHIFGDYVRAGMTVEMTYEMNQAKASVRAS